MAEERQVKSGGEGKVEFGGGEKGEVWRRRRGLSLEEERQAQSGGEGKVEFVKGEAG